MVASLCSNYSILTAIIASIVGGRVVTGGAPTVGVPLPPPPLYHLYHLYHHDLSEPLHHNLHHDLISILGKG
jgi:hypothetical protein